MASHKKINPRIVVYGLGFVGKQLAGFALDKGWEIVGAYNRAGAKVGQDLGTLIGRAPIGLVVEDCDKVNFTSLKADVGFVAMNDRLAENFAAYERLLGAGINVLCHGSESNNPCRANPELAAKIESMAKQHDVTFTGGGIWDMTRVWAGIIVAGPAIKIESMHHISNTEISRQGVHLLRRLGGGLTVAEYEAQGIAKHKGISGIPSIPSLCVVDGLGFDVKEIKEHIEPIVWEVTHFSKALNQELSPGTVVGTRMLVDITTEQGPTVHSCFEYREFREGEVEEMRWKVKGKPGMEICITREDSDMASASSLFNRTPDIIEAEPGIVEMWKYRPLRPSIF